MRITALAAAAFLVVGCAPAARLKHAHGNVACIERAAQIMTANVSAIAHRRYAAASKAAQAAAALSLSCNDRWRAANALIVAAELAHEAQEPQKARRLAVRAYALMHSWHPRNLSDLQASLVAQQLHTARGDLQGQWVYW